MIAGRSPAPSPGGSRPLRVGVVGAGRFGGHHAHVFGRLAGVELVAIADTNPTRAAEIAQTSGSPAIDTDYRELLERGLDAVSVATPDHSHGPIVMAALDAGCHVFCEKPLATTGAEAATMVAAARESGLILAVDFHNRVNPAIVAVREAIGSGRLGQPRHGNARLSNTLAIPRDMLSWAAHTSALWFLGSHVVDALRFVLDDEVDRVYARSGHGQLAAMGIDAPDYHLVMLEFRSGTVVTMENSWILPTGDASPFTFGLEIVGSAGAAKVDTSHHGAVSIVGEAGIEYPDLFGVTPSGPGRVAGFVHEAIARFVDSIVSGGPVLADGSDGHAAAVVLEAIEASADSGQPVQVLSS